MIDLLSFLVPAFLAMTMYMCTNSFLFAGIIFLISIICFLFNYRPTIKKYLFKKQRYEEMSVFINNFCTSLSIKQSLYSSLEITMVNCSNNLKNIIDKISDLNDMEKLIYLERYFPFRSYKIFTKMMSIWEEQGGNVLTITSSLLFDIKNEGDYLLYSKSKFNKHLIETMSLWLISFAVLLVLRFALANIYSSISNQVIFQIGVLLMMIVFLFSIYMLLAKLKKVEIRGWQNEIK